MKFQNSPTELNGKIRPNLDKLFVFLGFFLCIEVNVQLILTHHIQASPPTPAPLEPEKYPMDTPLPGPAGPYSSWLLKSLKTWPPASVHFLTDRDHPLPNPVEILCLSRPNAPNSVGAAQRMLIQAPFSQVESVVDGIDHYAELFPDYKQIQVVSRDGNRWLTVWEQIIPLFFVPNVKYEMTYLLNRPSVSRKIYRYQLHEKKSLLFSDGAIVIEALPSGATLYTEFDFFDADWGIAASFGGDRIWSDSIEGLYLSDLAIKLKAENPSWSYKKAADEAKTYRKRFPVREMIRTKIPFPPEDPSR